jgi:hypothetical protein
MEGFLLFFFKKFLDHIITRGDFFMSNLEMLERLTKGIEATETITIEGEEIEIRPLTSGELSQLQIIEKKGFVMKVGVGAKGKRTNVQTNNTDVDINAGEFTQYQSEALYKAVAWGLSVNGENVKPEQVEALPAGLPEQIFVEIVRISNIKDNDLTIIKNFRKE